MGDLLKQLKEYASGPLYPMHMPGHKRRLCPNPDFPYGWDMTEVENLDDLHEAEGILKEAMDRTAALCGTEQTWYLINGSTCGLLAAVRTFARHGSEILIARNCHKSVYHAIELGCLTAHYITPPIDSTFSVYGSIRPEDVERSLISYPNTSCVVITSPTYEGVTSDIRSIADICHRHGVPLVVDEAHGAHLGLFSGWPDSAVHLGADLVVQSAHKTLPSLTQTALLHMPKGSRADPEEVERQLAVFETSSPSYPLMASLDSCTSLLLEHGKELFDRWLLNLQEFDKAVKDLQHFKVLCHGNDSLHPDFYGFDPGKLPVSTAGTQFTGTSLAQALRTEYHFETEMACGSLTLGMTSPADSQQDILRFADALLQLDAKAENHPMPPAMILPAPGKSKEPIASALYCPSAEISAEDALGHVSSEYVWAYPPGVPLIVPGESVTEDFLACVEALHQSGTRIHHSHCRKSGYLRVFA